MIPNSDSDIDSVQEGELNFLNVTDSQTEDVGKVISSESSRRVLRVVYDEPVTPSEVAEELDMSIQNASYHLKKLLEADLIQVAESRYSEKGAEMDVYTPSESPIVLFVGSDERQDTFLDLFKRLTGVISLLLFVSIMIGIVIEDSILFGIQTNVSAGDPATDIPAAIGFLCGGLFILILFELYRAWNRWVAQKSV